MLKRPLFGVLLTFMSLQAQSLDNVLQDVLTTNPVIAERLHNFEASRADVKAARSGYYPTVDLMLAAGQEETERTGMSDTDFDVTQASLTLRQNLFKGFETLHRTQEQDARSVAAAYSYVETLNDTAYDVVATYLEVLRRNELVAIAKRNVEINAEIFNKVNKLYKSGLTNLSEVNKIESSLALARSNTVVNETNLASARFALKRLAGRDSDPKTMSRPKSDGLLPKDKKSVYVFALENNPSLLIGSYNIRQSEAAKAAARSAYYPTLDLEISQSHSEHLDAFAGDKDQFRAMATLNVNLFSGFGDEAAIVKNTALIRQEQAKHESLRREVTESLDLAWSNYEQLKQQLAHLNDYQSFSLKTLTLYSKEYDLGRRSLLDLLAAQSDYIGAQSQIINAEYDILLARYRILDAMGLITLSVLGDGSDFYNRVGLQKPSHP